MDRSVYDRMNEIEAGHWWFSGRRAIIAALVGRILGPRRSARILEAGCGSGGNLDMLGRFASVDAFEYDETARHHAVAKSGLDVRAGALPDQVPFEDRRYDLIGLFDVLEHVEDDKGSLRALSQRLDRDGCILVTVPAFPWLWSRHDERHHHFRRYTRASLARTAAEAGLKVRHASYFNTLLFPVAVLGRAVKTLTGSDAPDDQLPRAGVNRLLSRVFAFERHVVSRVRMPFGLSLFAVLERA